MKEKLKKYFNKDKIFIWICTILIALFVAMSVIFLKKDVEDNKNKQSEISLCDTEINLNTSWTINQDGNLVGNNLFDINKLSTTQFTINGDSFSFSFTNDRNNGVPYDMAPRLSDVFDINVGDTCVWNAEFTNVYTEEIYLSGTGTDWYVNTPHTFTQADLNGTIYIYGVSNQLCTFSKLMCNLGTSVMPWEPYLSMV